MAISVEVGANVAPFKSAMAEAAASAKTLDAAMKANEQQLKATGNEEQYMQQKAQLLSAAMNAQQSIAKNAEQALAAMAEGGVSQTSTAYQQMQAKMLTAYGTMNSIQAQMNSLDASASGAAESADTLSTSVEGIGKKLSLDQVINGIDKITNKMEQAARSAVKFGSRLWEAMGGSADWADELATDAIKFNVSAEDLQRMKYASEFVDTSVETIVKTRNQLAKNKDSKDAIEIFDLLGIDSGKDWESLFWETGAALIALGDTADAEAKSMKLFGKSWDELKPLFRMSAADLEEFGSARERYNTLMQEAPVVSDEDLGKLTALDDAFVKLESEFKTAKESVMSELAPAFTTVSDGLSGLLAQFNAYLKTEEGQGMMESLGESVKALFEGLGDIDFASAIETVRGGIQGVTDALGWIKDNQSAVEGAMKGIVIAWGALELTGGALQIVQLINGIQGLVGGGAAAAGAAAGSAWGGAFAAAVNTAFNAVPGFAFLMTLLTPNKAGGSLSEVSADKLMQDEQTQQIREFLTKSEYGPTAIPLEAYNRLQELWDLYRDPQRDREAYEAAFRASEFDFKSKPDIWKSLMTDMANLPTDMENLPNEFFKLPVSLEPDTEAAAAEIAATEAHMPVTLDFSLSAGPSTGRIRTPQGWKLPGNANGLPYVPYDGFLTYLHAGERVLTAAANRQYTANSYFNVGTMNMNNGMDADSLAAQMAAQTRQTMNGFGTR